MRQHFASSKQSFFRLPITWSDGLAQNICHYAKCILRYVEKAKYIRKRQHNMCTLQLSFVCSSWTYNYVYLHIVRSLFSLRVELRCNLRTSVATTHCFSHTVSIYRSRELASIWQHTIHEHDTDRAVKQNKRWHRCSPAMLVCNQMEAPYLLPWALLFSSTICFAKFIPTSNGNRDSRSHSACASPWRSSPVLLLCSHSGTMCYI